MMIEISKETAKKLLEKLSEIKNRMSIYLKMLQ